MIQQHDLTPVELPIGDVREHPDNPRQGDVGAIVESMKRNGVYQPIIVQRSTGHVLAGNHRLKALRALGAETVQAVMLDVTDTQARAILAADNRTADLATYDEDALAALLTGLAETPEGLIGTGYDGDDLDTLLGDLAQRELTPHEYTQKVVSPIYEPTGPMPPVHKLADTERRDALIAEIDAAPIDDEDLREFLRAAAHRHTRFDYEAIANYYAHAEPAVQRLMEASALVIIDYEQAVERGYVRLNAAIDAAFEEDYPDA